MGVLGNIMSGIFGSKATAATQSQTAAEKVAASAIPTAAQPTSPESRISAASSGSIDVTAILDKAVAAKKEKLEWRTSIVDLMKALNLDSSLSARKELAHDLHYDGDTNDSAKMNIWLHKQVMKKLAENGGQVPAELKA